MDRLAGRHATRHRLRNPARREALIRVAYRTLSIFLYVLSLLLFVTQLCLQAVIEWIHPLLLFVLVSPLFLLELVCYLRASFTQNVLPALEDLPPGLPLCDVCGNPKPPRTHHCRHCNRCIPKMDHHCVWIANCVGFNNHKYFILMLIYVDLTHACVCALSALQVVSSVILLVLGIRSILYHVAVLVVASGQLVLSGMFLCLTVGMLGFQLFNVARNETHIEAKANNRRCCRRGWRWWNEQNEFGFGLVWNMRQVFGKNPLLAVLPVFTSEGDGVDFPVNVPLEQDFV